MEPIAIIGAGGQGRVALEILKHQYEVAFIDDNPNLEEVGGFPVVGTTNDLEQLRVDFPNAFVAIGNNDVREQLLIRLKSFDFTLPNAIHSAAVVASTATLGDNVLLCACSVVSAEVRLGDGVVVYPGVVIEHDSIVDDLAYFAPGANISGSCRIGRSAYIGAGASTIHNITIGECATVGAGAAVIKDVPPNETVVGVPAQQVVRKV